MKTAPHQKMRSILPVDMTLINKPQIDLVNQCGRLEGVVPAKLSRGDAAQLSIDERQQLIQCAAVATTPVAEELNRKLFTGSLTHSDGRLRDLH
jgi:hypothetical protein